MNVREDTIFRIDVLFYFLACDVKVPKPKIVITEGKQATLEWDIHRPWNYILNKVQCDKEVKGKQAILVARKSGAAFITTWNAPERLSTEKYGDRYLIIIQNVTKEDEATYSCRVQCISGRPFYYMKDVQLVVGEYDVMSHLPFNKYRKS